ncbi:DUF948 domain-containing protein [bacterium]|nr:DUF948 domain-containing protein [bacterium]
METELSQSLTFLAWTSAGFLIVVGIFIVKLLFDLSRLTMSLNKSADIVKTELEPIMKNVSETVVTVNKLVQTTDEKVSKAKEIYDRVSKVVINTAAKASEISGYVLKEVFKGLCASFKSIIIKK